jgi:enterochelin esterase-like enzyme
VLPNQSKIFRFYLLLLARLLGLNTILALGAIMVGCQSASPTPLTGKSPSPVPAQTEAPSPTNQPAVTPTASPNLTPEWTQTPSPFVSPSPAPCLVTQGKVYSLQASFDFFPKPLQFQLYLPPCYSPTTRVRYPLLILLHGQDSDDQQWVRLGSAAAADRLISSNQSAPFLIAMPYEEYDLQEPEESTFGKLVTQGLVPWLDQHYNTCSERACRAIGGLSRGAAWAVRLGFTDWQQFGEIGAHSLAYFWGDNVMLRQWTRAIPVDQFQSVYMDIGDQDPYLPSATGFEGLLAQYQVPHAWLINQGVHNENYWRVHVEEYLRWYSRAWTKQVQNIP